MCVIVIYLTLTVFLNQELLMDYAFMNTNLPITAQCRSTEFYIFDIAMYFDTLESYNAF